MLWISVMEYLRSSELEKVAILHVSNVNSLTSMGGAHNFIYGRSDKNSM